MSQYSAPPPPTVAVPAESNPLGLAGFICSLVGLVMTGGLLCPIGLILSLIALGRQPRGFAVAGVVIGLIGTCGGLLVVLVFGAMILTAIGMGVVFLGEAQKSEISNDMVDLAVAIKAYEAENRSLPATLEVLELDSQKLIDPWGQRYGYHFEPALASGFDIYSTGKDRKSGTDDDLRFSEMGVTWEPGALNLSVQESADGGRVTITAFGRSLTASGDDEGGRVEIDLGDRVIEIVGDESGGRVNVGPGAGRADEATGDGPGDGDTDAGGAAPNDPPPTSPG